MRLSKDDARFYNADRDLAYCCPHLMFRAVAGLDKERQEEWVQQYVAQHLVSDAELLDVAKSMSDYLNATALDPTNQQPFDALTAAGFFKLRPSVQTLMLAKLGQVFLSAIFPSIRDTVRDPQTPPLGADKMIEAVHSLETSLRPKNTLWSRCCALLWWDGSKKGV